MIGNQKERDAGEKALLGEGGHRPPAHCGFQALAYRANSSDRYHCSREQSLIANRLSIAASLSKPLKHKFNVLGRQNIFHTTNWIRNFNEVAKHAPLRALVALLRSGLHGCFKKHRFGEDTFCVVQKV